MSLSHKQKVKIANLIHDGFDDQVKNLANKLFTKGARTRDWHRGMIRLVKNNALKNEMLGRERVLTSSEKKSLFSKLTPELERLQKWADDIGLKRMIHQDISIDGLVARGNLYAGFGRSLFYETAGESAVDFIVEDYISVDDAGTCSSCLEAQDNGPYLPSEGPMPGVICEGFGNCRCERQQRVDRIAWLTLTAIG